MLWNTPSRTPGGPRTTALVQGPPECGHAGQQTNQRAGSQRVGGVAEVILTAVESEAADGEAGGQLLEVTFCVADALRKHHATSVGLQFQTGVEST